MRRFLLTRQQLLVTFNCPDHYLVCWLRACKVTRLRVVIETCAEDAHYQDGDVRGSGRPAGQVGSRCLKFRGVGSKVLEICILLALLSCIYGLL